MVTAPIPFFDVSTTNDIDITQSCVSNVCNRNWYILGEEVLNFEAEFAAYNGTRQCVSVANGTDAITLALKAVGVRHSDRVALVANAGFYGSTAVHAVGAEPLYIDVSRTTRNMNPKELAKTLESTSVSAVVVTHLYGQAADIEAIVAVCDKHKVPLIEDCAQAHGAIINERKVGSFGTVGCFSFYPTKNLGALGDGGALVTNQESIANSLRELRQYGWDNKYRVATSCGQNSRLDEIQAAILRKKLGLLDGWNEDRRQIALAYSAALDKYVETPTITESTVAHLYVIQCDERDQLKEHLTSAGIATDIHYPIPDHQQPAYGMEIGLPNTEYLARTCLSLPCYPGMPQQNVDKVIEQVCQFFKKL